MAWIFFNDTFRFYMQSTSLFHLLQKIRKITQKSFCRHSISASLLFFVTHRDIFFFNIIFSFMFIIFNVNGRDEIFYGILFTRHLQATYLARGLETILYITIHIDSKQTSLRIPTPPHPKFGPVLESTMKQLC